ncbi:hypothetical protein TNCV_2912291 [Trichonephila clavipes]|nr:hypothetical protein TNCV_2912291 [Trichonephila clavipes]
MKNCSNRFSHSSLEPNFLSVRKFCNAKKGGDRSVPDPDYMVDALKLPNQAHKFSSESLNARVAWRRWNTTPLPLANSGRFWSIAIFKRFSG